MIYSNCKEPGIVGVIEIVKEATADGKSQIPSQLTQLKGVV